MHRIFVAVLFCAAAAANVFAQLPNQAGQIWREYPAFVESGPPGAVAGTYVPHRHDFGLEVVRMIGKQMAPGPDADFGLINCDDRKIYVYHTPKMHEKVNELVARFARPGTRDVQFMAETRLYSLSEKSAKPGNVPDLRAEFYELLHPILKDGDKPISETPGVHAYWIAKEDFSKFDAARVKMSDTASAHVESNLLQAPSVTFFNGSRGTIQDTTLQPFVADVIPFRGDDGAAYNPVISILNEGTWIEVFSLLSYDGKTVTTDFSAGFAKIEKVGIAKVVEGEETEENGKKVESGVSLQVPFQNKTEFAVDDVTWPADGMLVLFVTGIERKTERVVSGAKAPRLSRIPYADRFFKNTAIGWETQTLNVVVTVKMLEETK